MHGSQRQCPWWIGGLILALAWAAPAEAQAHRATVNMTDRFNVVITDDTPRDPGVRLQLTPLGNDECGRTWYLDGQFTRTAGTDSGTFNGTMTRCTTKTLQDQCLRLGRPIGQNYDKPASGTFQSTPQGLVLTVNYQAEKWNQTDCKFEKQDRGQDVIRISRVTTGDTRNPWPVTFDELVRGALYGAGGSGHPLR